MNRLGKARPSPAGVIALIALVVAIGGVAVAAIPDSNGVIRGCYNNTNGNLRAVGASSECRNNETPIAWDQQGPKGDPGSSGMVELARLHFSDVTAFSATQTFQLAKTVGTATKTRSSTTLRVTWEGSGAVPNGSCEYQIRVDGLKDNGSSSALPEDDSGGVALVTGGGSQSIHAMTLFEGLGAGPHTVSIWARALSQVGFCFVGPQEPDASRGQDVFVEELAN
jgi:hypothetical protein